ncbi:MAG TPA: hypothetical protein ENI23_01015 [bacterium]|nr:hypothetical protein [bacterium]
MKRKPTPPKATADQLLNAFLKEKGILIATSQQKITRTPDGLIVIHRPDVSAVFKDQIPKTDRIN